MNKHYEKFISESSRYIHLTKDVIHTLKPAHEDVSSPAQGVGK